MRVKGFALVVEGVAVLEIRIKTHIILAFRLKIFYFYRERRFHQFPKQHRKGDNRKSPLRRIFPPFLFAHTRKGVPVAA